MNKAFSTHAVQICQKDHNQILNVLSRSADDLVPEG